MTAPIREAVLFGLKKCLNDLTPDIARARAAEAFPQIRWTDKQIEQFNEHFGKNKARALKPIDNSLKAKGYDV